jgi:hypothetical protein
MNAAVADNGEKGRAWAADRLKDPSLFAAVFCDAIQTTRTGTFGRRAVRLVDQLRWDELISLVGDEQALREHIGLLPAELTSEDETIGRAINLAERYLTGWRPTPFESPITVQASRHAPQAFLTPPPTQPWPDLVLRAVGVFPQPPTASGAPELDSDFRQTMLAALEGSELSALRERISRRLGLATDHLTWRRDSDLPSSTTASFKSGPEDENAVPAPLEYRCVVQLPTALSPSTVLVVCDGFLRLPRDGGQKDLSDVSPLLTLADVANVLAVLLRMAGEELPEGALSLLTGSHLPLTSVELHLAAARPNPSAESKAMTLADTIDLGPLGATIRSLPSEGSFAAGGNLALQGDREPGNLVLRALRRMASDWGYDEPDAGLPQPGSVPG